MTAPTNPVSKQAGIDELSRIIERIEQKVDRIADKISGNAITEVAAL